MFSKTNSPSSSSKPAETVKKSAATSSARPSSGVPSILAADLIITGDIVTDGDVQIEGRLDGNVKAASITIGEQGLVNGTIKAGNCHIRGKVTGKVIANVVELSETANVEADLTQDQLTIANGAFFDGKCTRKTKPSVSANKKSPAKA